MKYLECQIKAKRSYLKRYPWRRSVTLAKQRCENPNNPTFEEYGGRGIKCFLSNDQAKKLWIRDQASLLKQPSLDRKDPDKHYTYDNCQFIEMNINNSKDKRVKVYQRNKEGYLIHRFNSLIEAARNNNTSSTAIKYAIKHHTFLRNHYWESM